MGVGADIRHAFGWGGKGCCKSNFAGDATMLKMALPVGFPKEYKIWDGEHV